MIETNVGASSLPHVSHPHCAPPARGVGESGRGYSGSGRVGWEARGGMAFQNPQCEEMRE